MVNLLLKQGYMENINCTFLLQDDCNPRLLPYRCLLPTLANSLFLYAVYNKHSPSVFVSVISSSTITQVSSIFQLQRSQNSLLRAQSLGIPLGSTQNILSPVPGGHPQKPLLYLMPSWFLRHHTPVGSETSSVPVDFRVGLVLVVQGTSLSLGNWVSGMLLMLLTGQSL